MGHAHYMQQGWRVLLSVYDTSCYDFVIERDGEYRSVNVKQATRRKDRTRGYWIANAGGLPRDIVPDLYLVWLPRERQFVELPGDHLKGRSSRSVPMNMFSHMKEESQ
jgi:hypothetical protein